MAYDILCHNSQYGKGEELYTFRSSVLCGRNMERCLIIPIFFLALMIFSLRCFLKDKLESSMRPKCCWAVIFVTTVPFYIICVRFELDFLQENKTSVAFLVGSGLNSNFH